MATKTITTTVTLHVKDEAKSRPYKFNPLTGARIPNSGKNVIITVPPGKPVKMDADEADRILARFGGEETKAPAVAVVAPKPAETSEDGTEFVEAGEQSTGEAGGSAGEAGSSSKSKK